MTDREYPMDDVTDYYEAGLFNRFALDTYLLTLERECFESWDKRQHIQVRDAGSTILKTRMAVSGKRLVLDSIKATHERKRIGGKRVRREITTHRG